MKTTNPVGLLRLVALSLLLGSATLAAQAATDYYVVVPILGKTVSTPVPEPENITVTLSSFPLPAGERLTAYAFDLNSVLNVTGDSAYDASKVSWSVVSGSLPQGLSLVTAGRLEGVPQVRSDSGVSFDVEAAYKGESDAQRYTITIAGAKLLAKKIVTGSGSTCALLQDNTIKCWGNNTYGQLATGGSETSLYPVDVVNAFGGRTVTDIYMNNVHGCALTADNKAYCWGAAYRNGAPGDLRVPTEVQGLTEGVQKLALGGGHTCALTLLGTVKCWGYNNEGALASASHSYQPVLISALGTGVTDIAAGLENTCAKKADGWWCWGRNLNGELGLGDTTSRGTPVKQTLPTGLSFEKLAMGSNFTCGVTAGGATYCVGRNDFGQLGIGDMVSRTSFTLASGLVGVEEISLGGNSGCARSGSQLRCWGRNSVGQLGNGSLTDSATPVLLTNVAAQQVAVGSGSACGIDTQGRAMCWGNNPEGRLGDGTSTIRTSPVFVRD